MSTAFEDDPHAHRADAAMGELEPTTALRLPSGPSLDSQLLFQGGRTVTIRHNGEIYRLQATRQGKLILTK